MSVRYQDHAYRSHTCTVPAVQAISRTRCRIPSPVDCAPAARWNCRVDEELRRELLARRDEDQRIRNLVSTLPGRHLVRLPEELAAEWQRIDEENTRWLAEVLSARGWPGRTLVGEEGAGAAWLLAQHADRDLVQQRAFLHALRSAAAGLDPFADYEARMRDQS